MGSEAAVERLPEIAPIRTAVVRDEAAEDAVTTDASKKEEVEACVTPKPADEALVEPALACPPPPRKPRPPKRKTVPPPQGYFAVPHDLSLVFLPLPGPPKKIIRVG